LSGSSVTAAVGDQLYVVYEGTTNTEYTSTARTGTATLGAAVAEASAGISGTQFNFHRRIPITAGGTITALTITHTSVAKRAAQAILIRGIDVPRVGASGLTNSGAATGPWSGDTILTTQPVFVIAAHVWAGTTADNATAVVTGADWDSPDEHVETTVVSTSGGSAASNRAIKLLYVVSQDNPIDTATNGGIQWATTTGRSSTGFAMFYNVTQLPPDAAYVRAAQQATLPNPYVATRPRTM
jgi:hypothetical protein